MNITFKSTRSRQTVSATEAILKGISNEGGLFVPTKFPKVEPDSLLNKDYKEICFRVLKGYLEEFKEDKLKEIIDKAYSKFSTPEVTPVVKVGETNILELFHGPTLAFKDVALSILPYLIKESSAIQNVSDEIVILTATSGDTGKAALEGFADVEGTKIVVFYPSQGVSTIQKKQMVSQKGKNVYVLGIEGNFDDAQSGVKAIFNDTDFKEKCSNKNIILSSANSINIGRLLPQIVYYYSAYMQLVENSTIKLGDKINFTVPTGNFGDILAGYYAKQMGLPVNKLICASNSNNVLYDFFKTGKYDKNRDFIKTISPSMDILISSNFERLLYHESNGNEVLIKELMERLNKEGHYSVSAEIKENISSVFYGNYCSENDTKKTIKEVYENHNYVLDTHTGVAYKVYEDYVKDTGDLTPNVILSTASPFKFAKSVYEAIFGESQGDEYKIIDELSQRASLKVPTPIEELKSSPVLHKDTIAPEDMKNAMGRILNV